MWRWRLFACALAAVGVWAEVARLGLGEEVSRALIAADEPASIRQLRLRNRPIVIASPEETAAREKIEHSLDEQTKVDFTDVALDDAVTFLKDYHNIQIQVDRKALEDASIGPETPLTAQIEGVTLRSALELLLRPLGLAIVIHDEVLLITTREKAADMLVVKIYPVADLATPREGAKEGDDLRMLVELIRATVAPGNPAAEGRPAPLVAPIPQAQALVVMQTDDVHQRVAELLDGLRRAREVQGLGKER